MNSPFTNLKQVDNLSGYAERSLWQRLQLWRLGGAPTRTSVAVGGLVLLSLMIIGIEIMAMSFWIPWAMNSLGGVELKITIVITLALVAVSVATIALAYCHWCRSDLD